MTPQRLLLGLVAILGGLSCLYLATQDLHYNERNCGTALLATDPTRLSVDTDDLEADEFAEQSIITNCDQLILERRFLAAVPAVVAVAAIVTGRRLRDRPRPEMRGSIFGTEPSGRR